MRTQLVGMIARSLGHSSIGTGNTMGVIGSDVLVRAYAGNRARFRNSDGSTWTPQDSNLNFPYLPGFDGPIE